ncbi:MAG: hypothetical protein JWQ35_2125 [Bacteriovoracaceae bacterium]|nr:hypothetical protein [Bacteriovoracaceae bacterium]
MSLRAIIAAAKQRFPWFRIAGIFALISLLAFVIYLAWFHHRNANDEERQRAGKQKVIETLMAIRAETGQVEDKLKKQLHASLSSDLPKERRATSDRQSRTPLLLGFNPGAGFSKISPPETPVYIPSGSVFRAQLMMPIKTSIQSNFIMARVTNEFRMDAVRRIPRNSRLIGSAQLDPMLKGVVVRFRTLVSPRGIEFPVNILALSPELFPELDGIYFTNDLETYSSVLAFGFLSGFADAARQTQPTIIGSIPSVTLQNDVLSGASTASFRVAEELLQDIRRRSVEYIVVPAGQRIFVIFEQKFILQNSKPIPD